MNATTLSACNFTAVTVTTNHRTFDWWIYAADDIEALKLARQHWPKSKLVVTKHGHRTTGWR